MRVCVCERERERERERGSVGERGGMVFCTIHPHVSLGKQICGFGSWIVEMEVQPKLGQLLNQRPKKISGRHFGLIFCPTKICFTLQGCVTETTLMTLHEMTARISLCSLAFS